MAGIARGSYRAVQRSICQVQRLMIGSIRKYPPNMWTWDALSTLFGGCCLVVALLRLVLHKRDTFGGYTGALFFFHYVLIFMSGEPSFPRKRRYGLPFSYVLLGDSSYRG